MDSIIHGAESARQINSHIFHHGDAEYSEGKEKGNALGDCHAALTVTDL